MTTIAERAPGAADCERAERAADRADRRARDADRISRWTVGVALTVAVVIVSTVIALVYRFAAVEAALERLIDLH